MLSLTSCVTHFGVTSSIAILWSDGKVTATFQVLPLKRTAELQAVKVVTLEKLEEKERLREREREIERKREVRKRRSKIYKYTYL